MQYPYPTPQYPNGAYSQSQPPPRQQQQHFPPAGYPIPNGPPPSTAPAMGSQNFYMPQQQSPRHPMVVIPQHPQYPQHHAQQRQYQQYAAPPTPLYAVPSPQQPRPPPQRQQYPQAPQARPVQAQHATPNSSVQVRIPPQLPPMPIATDYVGLMISMGEEYVAEARKVGPVVAVSQNEDDQATYYKLMATGMACMHSALQVMKKPAPYNLPSPNAWNSRKEMELVLRYASLLYEETEDDFRAEELLGKAIPTCERLRYKDLRYSMQHLSVRLMFRTNPRAAVKMCGDMLGHVEMYTHQSWFYAFRFLRTTMLLKLGTQADKQAALRDLEWISGYSKRAKDRALHVWSSTLEAMVHILMGQSDSMEKAQRAIASARSFQFALQGQAVTPVLTLLNLVDLSCNLLQYDSKQASAKKEALQAIVDDYSEARGDKLFDPNFSILIESTEVKIQGDLTTHTGGLFEKISDGRDKIVVAWMCPRDASLLAYYMTGVTAALKDSHDEKAEDNLLFGLQCVRENFTKVRRAPASINETAKRVSWTGFLEACILVQLTFFACNKAKWSVARSYWDALRRDSSWTPDTPPEEMDMIDWLALYLDGIIEQGCGHFQQALLAYHYLTKNAPKNRDSTHQLSALATMNTLLIIHDPSHPNNPQSSELLEELEKYCPGHPNRSIGAAFGLFKALGMGHNSETTTIKRKQFLMDAIKAAKEVSNGQLLTISMNFMAAKYFTGIVGEPAQKSAVVGRNLAKQNGSALWSCVADGILAQTQELHGNQQNAQATLMDAERFREKLPEQLR